RIGDDRRRGEAEDAVAIAGEVGGALGVADPHRRVHEERLDHGEAGEIEHAVVDGEEDGVDRAVQAAAAVDRWRAADGDGAHGPLSREDAAVVPLAAAIDAAAGGEDAIDPALEDRRQPEPPERE